MSTSDNSETISEKTLNSTRVGGVSAILLAGLSAVVPVVQSLTEKQVPAGVIIAMEALAAVLACVAAWIYTVDAKTRTELAKARMSAAKDAVAAKDNAPAAHGDAGKLAESVTADDSRYYVVITDADLRRIKESALNGRS